MQTREVTGQTGGGYGGQTLVNDQLLNVTCAKIFDLPIVNKLIDRYLSSHLLNGAFETTQTSKLRKTRTTAAFSVKRKIQFILSVVFLVLAWTRVIATDLRYLYQVGKDEKQMGELRKVFKQELRENQLMKIPFFETFDEKIRKALKRKPDTSRPENTEPRMLRRRRRLL